MAERIETPPELQGDEKAQLTQMWRYLYQLSEAINNNMDAIGGNELTDQERVILAEVLGRGEYAPEYTEFETLKSLIIKTADFVQTKLQEYRMKLLGETVASGQFGRYVRKTGLDVEVNPEGITQNYTFQEVVQGLKVFEINAKNYIKTGLLRTVDSLPVYGVAIGKDIVTFSEDGTETYNDGNKVAELTAEELSFWQNGTKIASYKGTDITFYAGDSKRVVMDANGVTFYYGNTKLTELLSTALKFYNGGNLRAQMDADGVKLMNGSTTLAEFLATALKFYYNGTLRTQMDSDGVKIKNGNTTLAEFLGTALKFYYAGTLRTQMDSDGVKMMNGNTTLAEFLGSAVKFYSGGLQRAQMDADGVKLSYGNLKLAEFLSDALKFYYAGTLRAQMDTDGVKLMNGSTKLAEFLTSALKFYYGGNLRTQVDNDGMKIYNGSVKVAEFLSNAIKFYDGGSLIFYIQSGKIYSAQDLELSASKKVIMGDWKVSDDGLTLMSANDRIGFEIAKYTDRDGDKSGIYYHYGTDASGNKSGEILFVTRLYDTTTGQYNYGTFVMEILKTGSNMRQYLYPGAGVDAALGSIDVPFKSGSFENIEFHGVNSIGHGLIFLPDIDDLGYQRGFEITRVNSGSEKQIKFMAQSGIDRMLFYGDLANKETTLTNMDLITKHGTYWINTTNMQNIPSGIATGLTLLHVNYYSSTMIEQMLSTDSDYYKRRYINNAWTSWYKFSGTAV